MIVLGPVEKDPFKPGLYLRGGDFCHPLDGKWMEVPYPTKVWRFFCPWRILPFLSVNLGFFRFYVGFKCYGVDSEHYKMWLPPEEVYDGSNALHLSARISRER